MEPIESKKARRVCKQFSAPFTNNNEDSDKIINILSSLKTKSVGDLDKLGKRERKNNRNATLLRGHTFCINPGQLTLPRDIDMPFTMNLLRQTPKMRLNALNILLNSLNQNITAYPEKTQKRATNYLGHLKISVFGDLKEKVLGDKDFIPFVSKIIKIGFVSTLINKLPFLDFEDRKIATLIFCNLMRRMVSEGQMVSYIQANPKLLFVMIDGYRNPPVALLYGRMLQECIRYEKLVTIVMNSEYLYEMFGFLKTPLFPVSSDAFVSFQSMFTEHKKMGAEFIKKNYDQFFSHYNQLLTCDNFMTQISSLKFLGMLLLDRRFYEIMRIYVQDTSNLKRLLKLMSSPSTSQTVQMEGFHIFKVFLANPDPSPPVRTIFIRNKERITKLLMMIDGTPRYGDDFNDERAFLIKQLDGMDQGTSNNNSTGSTSDCSEETDSNLSNANQTCPF